MNQYIALARKWRPKNFNEFVGQQHIVTTLINSLDNNRIHHAYIFSGTRGVGKTTLARLLAKCLNCEKGISSAPCNDCHSCRQINSGTSIDIIEVDAASRTKVEDTRDLLDNIQLSPSSSKYRIYLIDEVHMLSKHSFNALLKTLEEPPAHVKFLFATTEVEKLPITILSRCIHFKLKSIETSLINGYLKKLLVNEKVSFEEDAIEEISKSAQGSMRDALTLTEQFISFGNGKIINDDVIHLLGIFDKKHIFAILKAIIAKDTSTSLQKLHELAILNIDFDKILDSLIYLIHQITVKQALSNFKSQVDDDSNEINAFANTINPEDLQLLYQIALFGRKDLPLSPSHQIGLEMTIIRMIHFLPQANQTNIIINDKKPEPIKPRANKSSTTAKILPQKEPVNLTKENLSTSVEPIKSDIAWEDIIESLGLTSAAYVIASNCIANEISSSHISLTLNPKKGNILTDKIKERIQGALTNYFNKPFSLSITVGTTEDINTPINILNQKNKEKTETAKNNLLQDPNVQDIIKTFNAKIIDAKDAE